MSSLDIVLIIDLILCILIVACFVWIELGNKK